MKHNQEIDISVVVPLFNEEESVRHLHKAIADVLNTLGLRYEIIFVDDGSGDKTFELAKSLAAEDIHLKVIKFRKNYGQTPAMVAGMEYASGDILVTMDGDLQNDPKDIPRFIEKINEGYDIVVGWRHKRQDKFVTRKIPSIIANRLIGIVTGVPIKDNGCSLKAYRRRVIQNTPLYSEMHRFIPAMVSMMGAKIAEIKVNHHPRKFGQSKYGLTRIYKVLVDLITIKTILSILSRPIFVFGVVSFLSAFLSAVAMIIGIIQLFLMDAQSIVVIMGVSMLWGILSLFLFFSGILCELIYKTGNIKTNQFSRITAFMDVSNKVVAESIYND